MSLKKIEFGPSYLVFNARASKMVDVVDREQRSKTRVIAEIVRL